MATLPQGAREDQIFSGSLTLAQPLAGYRFTLDSLLLAAFAARYGGERVLDACAGVGVVGLAWRALREEGWVRLAEVQPELCALARYNVERNAMSDVVEVWQGDLREMPGLNGPHFDLALMNPPYFEPGHGRISPRDSRAAGRHTLHGDLAALVAAVHRHLDRAAPLCIVFPARDAPRLMQALQHVGRTRLDIVAVHPYAEAEASTLLVAARSSARGSWHLHPRLVVRKTPTDYSEQTRTIIESGRWTWHSDK